jgi:hypothetical protein
VPCGDFNPETLSLGNCSRLPFKLFLVELLYKFPSEFLMWRLQVCAVKFDSSKLQEFHRGKSWLEGRAPESRAILRLKIPSFSSLPLSGVASFWTSTVLELLWLFTLLWSPPKWDENGMKFMTIALAQPHTFRALPIVLQCE